MPATRAHARTAGVLYLLTFATSIPALALKQPYLNGTTSDPVALQAAALLEVMLALACIGTAVALHPVLSSRSPGLALGFVTSRTLEAGIVATGVVAMLALVAVRGAGGAGSDADTALVALHDGAFLVGPGLMPAVNAALLGTALWRLRLVPRVLPLVGLIGAPLLAASAVATLFGVLDQVSPLAGLAALPIALWEFSIGVWLTIFGVRRDETMTA